MAGSERRDDGQGALDLTGLDSGPAFMVEAAVRRSLKAASEAGLVGELDAAVGALAAGCARAVDHGLKRHDPYAVAAAARELRETLVRLKLDPLSRDTGDDDDFGRLMREIMTNGSGDDRAGDRTT
jgi:hypothetical protein